MNTDRLLDRIEKSTCSFTTAKAAIDDLEKEGFEKLSLEDAKWNVKAGGKYYVSVYDSSVFAFAIGEEFEADKASDKSQMLRVVAAHTDHPCLYVKSNPEIEANGYKKLNAEIYGGSILNTWMDRPLSVAGRVSVKTDNPFEPEAKIIDMKKPLFTIPNLAIHMNRKVNSGIELNKQTDMAPIAGLTSEDMSEQFFLDMIAKEVGVKNEEILDYELFLYNCEKGSVLGMDEELLSAPRLDNTTSVEACVRGIIDTKRTNGISSILLYDNEEIGSRTKQGADSALFSMIIDKIYRAMGVDEEAMQTAKMNSFIISLDVAHGFHPNKPEKSDPTNKVLLGEGVVIKRSSAQNYVTDSQAVATVMMIMDKSDIPYQKFASRSDVSQGGTLGSILTKYMPVKMVDMGAPILAMHSARELMAVSDFDALCDMVREFFNV